MKSVVRPGILREETSPSDATVPTVCHLHDGGKRRAGTERRETDAACFLGASIEDLGLYRARCVYTR